VTLEGGIDQAARRQEHFAAGGAAVSDETRRKQGFEALAHLGAGGLKVLDGIARDDFFQGVRVLVFG
jgi:hypothetical protein